MSTWHAFSSVTHLRGLETSPAVDALNGKAEVEERNSKCRFEGTQD